MRKFIVKLEVPVGYGVVVEGEEGYRPALFIHEEEQAARANEFLGNSPEEAEAAKICSMFGNWERFEEIVEGLKAREVH